MINKNAQDFLNTYDVDTMLDLILVINKLRNLYKKSNSQIIKDIIDNTLNYGNTTVNCTLYSLTPDDEYVINQLINELGYKVKVKQDFSKSGEKWTIKISLK